MRAGNVKQSKCAPLFKEVLDTQPRGLAHREPVELARLDEAHVGRLLVADGELVTAMAPAVHHG